MVSKRLDEDWDPADCLCQGTVPENKRIDYEHRIFDEKKDKWRWKVFLRYHIDCPIHGSKITENPKEA